MFSTNTIVIIILVLIICVIFLIMKLFNNVLSDLDIVKAQSRWTQEKLKDIESDTEHLIEEIKVTQDKITNLELKDND